MRNSLGTSLMTVHMENMLFFLKTSKIEGSGNQFAMKHFDIGIRN